MTPRERFTNLRSQLPAVLPSLLLCDFGNLQREIVALEEAGVPGLHLDVMDGNFVPNLSYGMPIVEAIRRLTDLPIDVHLMITQPQRYADDFVKAGADAITFHVEAADDPRATLEQIRAQDVAAGLALNPGTPLSQIEDCLDVCDLILVMSVEAGFGGQQFNPVALDKLRTLKDQVGDELLLEVDGGINNQTIASCSEAGAQLFVAGSAIFKTDNYSTAVSQLTILAASPVTS